MSDAFEPSRRRFMRSAAVGGGLLVAGERALHGADEKDAGKEEEISPAEDLMREHGVLRRVMLIYSEAVRRIEDRADLPTAAIAEIAGVVRSFIEDYHARLEEDYLFPRFQKANQMVDLVEVLRAQHQRGRALTDLTTSLASAQALRNPADRARLADSMRLFVRMYRPHAAREDTVLFPALRKIVPPREYDALGEEFEKKEHQLFGDEGFEKAVDKIAGIEKTLGIYDLAQYTPKV